MVLESKYGSPKIVNDGVTVAKEVELEDPVENIGAKARAPGKTQLLTRLHQILWYQLGRACAQTCKVAAGLSARLQI